MSATLPRPAATPMQHRPPPQRDDEGLEARIRRALYPAAPAGAPGGLGLAPLRPEPRSARGVPMVLVLLVFVAGLSVALVATSSGIRAQSTGGEEASAPGSAPGATGSGLASQGGATDGSGTAAGTGAVAASGAAERLEALAAGDDAAVEALAGSWVPQISSKRAGLVVDEQTYDEPGVLADHSGLRARYPDARLLRSARFSTYTSPDFWVTVVARPSTTAREANAWCEGHGFANDQCYAKLLSHTASPQHATVHRGGS